MEIKKLEDRLPLYCYPHSNSTETSFIADSEENFVARSVYNLDASYIVRAVNNYARALELLEEANRQIEYMHNKFKETGSGNAVYFQIKTFLDAEGKKQPDKRDSES